MLCDLALTFKHNICKNKNSIIKIIPGLFQRVASKDFFSKRIICKEKSYKMSKICYKISKIC